MEVSHEVIPRSSGKTGKTGKVGRARISDADVVDEIFWDAHWTLDDDDQQPESALALL